MFLPIKNPYPFDNCIEVLKFRHTLTPVSRKVISLNINTTCIINQAKGIKATIKLEAKANIGNTNIAKDIMNTTIKTIINNAT